MAKQAIDTYADLRNAGRINARIIDARSGQHNEFTLLIEEYRGEET